MDSLEKQIQLLYDQLGVLQKEHDAVVLIGQPHDPEYIKRKGLKSQIMIEIIKKTKSLQYLKEQKK